MIGRFTLLVAAALAGSPSVRAADPREEQGLRLAAADTVRVLEENGGVFHDPGVEAYLEEVLRRTVGPAAAGLTLRVRVLDAIANNAFSLPDGTIFVSADLLATIADEAELATLLGHEASHNLRHHLSQSRGALRRAGWITLATLGLGAVPAVAGFTSHARDQEREADADGIAMMVRAGYDPAAAVALEERLSEAARSLGQKDGGGWLGDHPSAQERIANARAAVARVPPGGERAADRYAAAVAPVRLRAASIEVVFGHLDRAERAAGAARDAAPSAGAWIVLGDVARFRKDGLAEAAVRYRRALALDPNSALAERGLGLALLRSGDTEGALRALGRYLELDPAAPDRPFIEADLRNPEGAAP